MLETEQKSSDLEASRRRRRSEQSRAVARQRAALRWWVGTVALTLFPTLTIILMALLRGSPPITWELILNDGELILASYLIVTSTLISTYTIKNETFLADVVRFILYFLSAIQLIAYTVIKTNESNNLLTVAIVSIGALIVAICLSWIWYILTNGGR